MIFIVNFDSCSLFVSPRFSPGILLSNWQGIPDFSTGNILGLVFDVFSHLNIITDQLYQFVLRVDLKLIILHQIDQIGPWYWKHELLALAEHLVKMLNNHFFAHGLQLGIQKFNRILVNMRNILRRHCLDVPLSEVFYQVFSFQSVRLGIQCVNVIVCQFTFDWIEILKKTL